MGQRFEALADKHIRFISRQKIFFVATAAAGGRVNLSPKGLDSLRVLAADRVVWLNLTGSGNETAAHVRQNPRMTLMFCAFEGAPMILRLYGTARAVHRADPEWDTLARHFAPLPGSRQIFDLKVDLVQTSCGMAVPCFEFAGERTQLNEWAENKGEAGLKRYWKQKNAQSLDGFETGMPNEPKA